jgi:predicted metal-dependent hydrolase
VDADAEVDGILHASARLWNAHRFFDCHDKLEEAWRLVKHEKKSEPAKDPRRDAIHGIILLAAAYVHWTRGNPVGVERKLAHARAAFARTPLTRLASIDLDRFRAQAEGDLERGARGEPYDARRVPTLIPGAP